jgi:PAS domain S-box-containing protein
MKQSTVQIDTLLRENIRLKEENARLRGVLDGLNIDYPPQKDYEVDMQEALQTDEAGALRESEERYSSLFRNVTLGIAHCRTILDKSGIPVDYEILHVNNAYTSVTGIKKEDIEGKTAKEIFPEIEKYSFDYIRNYGKIALEGGELNFEVYFEGLDQWLSIYVYSPKKYEFTAFFTDISSRKKAEAELSRSEERLKTIFENLTEGLMIADVKRNNLEWNPEALRLHGYSEPATRLDFITQFKEDFELTTTDGGPVSYSNWPLNRMLSGEQFRDYTLYLRNRKQGWRKVIAYSGSLVRDRKGNPLYGFLFLRDITDLRESEMRFRLLADNISQFAWIANSEGRMEWVNKRWIDFTGLTVNDLQGENSLAFVHPDFTARVVQSFTHAMLKGEHWEDIHPMKNRKGEYRWFLVRAVPVRDESGKITHWFGTHTDINEQKLAEEALKRNETLLKQAETMTNLGAWELQFISPDGSGDILSWSDQVFKIFGYPPGSFKVTNELFFEHVHPDDRQKISEALKKAINERSIYTVEHRIRRADGVMRIVIEHAEIIFDVHAKPVKVIGSIQDITERKLAEEKLMRALAEAEEGRNTLHAIMEYIPMGITIADAPDVNIRMVSKYGHQLLEKSDKEITGIPAPEHPSAWGVYRSDGVTHGTPEELPLSRATMKGEIVKNEEWYVTRNDGTLIPILCNAAPILDRDGKAIGGIIGWQDIAGLKKIERELKQRNEELSRFIYTVSHDLKSPLVTIKMFTLYLREDIENQNKEAQDKDLGYIDNAADKMGKLLEELLELSRIGRREEPEAEIILEPLIQSVIDILAGRIRERNANVQITAPPIAIEGHRQRLFQLYQNLIDNALKFMGEQTSPLIEIGANIENGELVFFVRDNGSGIDREFQNKVFGLFEKLDPGSEGTGIGLALVKRIVEIHEGHIWLTSERGEGTTFWFTLKKARLLNSKPAK